MSLDSPPVSAPITFDDDDAPGVEPLAHELDELERRMWNGIESA